MGFKVAWIAVRGKPADAVLANLKLARTGEFNSFPEAEFEFIAMPSGWSLVLNDFGRGDFLLDHPLAAVRAGAEILEFYVYENIGASHLCAYEDGRAIWRIDYDAERSIDRLQINGDPPPPFVRLHDDKLALQVEEDAKGDPADWSRTDHLLGLPADLGEALTGYRYDAMIKGLGPTPFEVLEPRHVMDAVGRTMR